LPERPTLRVRDRILRAAGALFYQRGIRSVGINSIVSEAGTNKMSFYRNFCSKDELVAEYVRDQEHRWWTWWNSVVSQHEDEPRAQLNALFEIHVKRANDRASRGCALANVAIEVADSTSTRQIIEFHKREVRLRFGRLAHEIGAKDPDILGDALMLLWEGVNIVRLEFPPARQPTRHVLRAVRSLIDAHVYASV
jgi:AcrR family transcriptional regulator